jgi:hypothetical protein
MHTDVVLQHISEKSEDLHNQFHQIVHPHRSSTDFSALGGLLAEHAENQVVGMGIDIGKARIRENSMGDWMSPVPGLRAETGALWGKPVVVFTIETAEGPKLWDVTCVDIEDGLIVRHRSHYFCKDLLAAAAKELGIPLDENKDLFGFPW